MRAPLIPTLLLALATSFGGAAYAADSAEALAVQLSIVALKANDNIGAPSFASSMVINGLTVPVTVTRDVNGALIITPDVDDNGFIAATDAKGKPVKVAASAVPNKFNVTTTTDINGAVQVATMTITAVDGKSVTLGAVAGATGFAVISGDQSAIAGILDPASTPVADGVQQNQSDASGQDVTDVTVSQVDTYVPQILVIPQDATNQTDPGNASGNPSPSTP